VSLQNIRKKFPQYSDISDQELVIGLDGLDALDNTAFGKGNFTNYGISSPVGDIVAFSADFQSDEGIFNGTVLENATVSATGSGTARDNGSSTANGGGAFIIVSSASGTAPTIDAKITHSADDSTYADLVTFTTATTATIAFRIVDFVDSPTSTVGDAFTDLLIKFNAGIHSYDNATGI